MNLDQITREESVRRREFPISEKKIFLAHAGVSPLPRCVATAMQQYAEAAMQNDQEDVLPDGFVGQTRQLTAELIGASREEIAFAGSTSMGLAMVAAGLDWRAGDNVVCYRDDYPANVHPWMNLARQGVEVRYVAPGQYGNVTVPDLEPVVDARTRLVSLASAHFVSGWRLDVDAVGQFLHERGALFCLDGIQTFGALATMMQHVDFAAADAHKWLLGPLGIAILYVRREHFERLRPVLVGAHTALTPDYLAQETMKFWPDARRYEPGSLNLVGLVGLNAALRMIQELGIGNIERRVLALAEHALICGRQCGLLPVGPTAGAGLSGIVAFESARSDLAEAHRRLAQAGIITSLRRRRDGARCLRLSAHFYNREAELTAAVEAL
jgi:cysteine desulfurase / selenocysteine lyase